MPAKTNGQSLPITVVLPTFNRGEVLVRAIRSVLAQTLSPAELIVVDDASTEDIASIVGSFDDPRIRYIRQTVRQGPGVARNLGVEEAHFDWIAFQDSDDEWLINKLALQWDAADAGGTDAALVCGAYIIVPRRGQPRLVAPSPAMKAHPWPMEARFEFPFIAPTWLLRRETFLKAGGFDTSLPNLEDWEFSFRIHDQGPIVALHDPLLIKHGSSDGLNKEAVKQAESLGRIRAKHASLFARSPKIHNEFLLRNALWLARLDDRKAVRQVMRDACATNVSAKNVMLYLASLFGLRAFRFLHRLMVASSAGS